jgi:hypothetical protein
MRRLHLLGVHILGAPAAIPRLAVVLDAAPHPGRFQVIVEMFVDLANELFHSASLLDHERRAKVRSFPRRFGIGALDPLIARTRLASSSRGCGYDNVGKAAGKNLPSVSSTR